MTNRQRIFSLLPLLVLLQLLLLTAIWIPTRADRAVAPLATANATAVRRLATLAHYADLVVRGQVASTASAWRADRRAIETEVTLGVHYMVAGAGPSVLTLHTEGGYLPEEGLGMVASHAATFRTGEEVLLFLRRAGERLVLVDEEVGKFSVRQGVAANGALRVQMRLEELYGLLGEGLLAQGRQTSTPSNWAVLEAGEADVRPASPEDFVFEELRWPGADPEIYFRANPSVPEAGGPDGSTEDFLAALTNAAVTWSIVPGAAFTLIYDGSISATDVEYNGVNEVIFFPGGQGSVAGRSRVWFNSERTILEADFWLNSDLDWDATGNPGPPELDVESAALHEFGHWLGLGHDSDSAAVMYFSLTTGSLRRALHPSDAAGISYIYPCPALPCIPEIYADPTETALSTELPTVTPTTTPTVTATQLPTATETPSPVQSETPGPSAPVGPTLPVRPTATIAPTTISQLGDLHTYLPLVQR